MVVILMIMMVMMMISLGALRPPGVRTPARHGEPRGAPRARAQGGRGARAQAQGDRVKAGKKGGVKQAF